MKNFLTKNWFQLLFVTASLVVGWYLYNKNNLTFKVPMLKINLPILEKPKKIVDFPSFEDKEFKLSYSSKPTSIVRELSRFEDGEKWSGDGEFDYLDYYEGKSSLFLASQDGIESEAIFELGEKINPDDYKTFKLFLKIGSEPSSIKELKLIFSDSQSAPVYEYSINKFKNGWNLLVIPVNELSRINWTKNPSKIIFKLVSQVSTSASINLDFLWAEKDDNYFDNWIARDDNFFFLNKYDQSLYFATTNNTGDLAVLKKITSADDYTVSIKFIPLKEGFFGLFLRGDLLNGYGYYFIIDGPGSDGWKIFKRGDFGSSQAKILKEGKFRFSIEKNLPLWFKADVQKKHLVFSISSDGEKFTLVGEADDGSYNYGKVGIISGNNFLLVNDIQFTQ